MSIETLWAFVVIAGPLLLLAALLWAKARGVRRNQDLDPETPLDDPSKGMTGHDTPPDR